MVVKDSEKMLLEGLTVKMSALGDLTITIHPASLQSSLNTFTSNQRNGTVLAVASKRLLPSSKGHTHSKPQVIQATCNKE